MEASLSVERRGAILVVRAAAPEGEAMELRLASDRNRHIEKTSDISAFAPAGWRPTNPRYVFPGGDREMYFLAVDVAVADDMAGVVRIEGAGPFDKLRASGRYVWNGPLVATEGRLDGDVIVPADQMEHWENSLYLTGTQARATGFYLRLPLTGGAEVRREIRLLSADWAGEVSLHRAGDDAAVATVRVEGETAQLPTLACEEELLPDETLRESLRRIVAALLAGRNMNPASRTYGGFFLLYDADARMHRVSHWLWAWGPTIRLLLAARDVAGVGDRLGCDEMLATARLAGQCSLSFVHTEPSHPAAGVATVRWEPTCQSEAGFREFISPSDSLFLCGWGWLALYEATGEGQYLAAARKLAETTAELMDRYPIVPQEYEPDLDEWTNHTCDESAFGMEGFAELHRLTGEERYRELAVRYIDSHIKCFDRGDGLWHRLFLREPSDLHWDGDSKGEAWAMAGLLAAARLREEYLPKAVAMADRMLEFQRADGVWGHYIDDAPADNPPNDKATAIWAWLMYRMAAMTDRADYLAAARRALAWCVVNQHTGPDAAALGTIVPLAGFMQINYHHLAVLYTTTYFGLALMEELKLRG